MPDNWDQEEVSPFSERELKALKIQTSHKVLVKTWHDSLGHLHSGNLSHSLKKMDIPAQHLTNIISNYQCNACDANMGRHGYLLKKPPVPVLSPVLSDTIATSPVSAPVATTPTPTISPGSILLTFAWITQIPGILVDQATGISSYSLTRLRNKFRIIIPRLVRTLLLLHY
jgi:hypothetical protein